jgi:hypothetical protein
MGTLAVVHRNAIALGTGMDQQNNRSQESVN